MKTKAYAISLQSGPATRIDNMPIFTMKDDKVGALLNYDGGGNAVIEMSEELFAMHKEFKFDEERRKLFVYFDDSAPKIGEMLKLNDRVGTVLVVTLENMAETMKYETLTPTYSDIVRQMCRKSGTAKANEIAIMILNAI